MAFTPCPGGADVVVADLAQVDVAMEPPSAWSLVFESFDPAQTGIRETLCTLGNGYFATRGAAVGAVAECTTLYCDEGRKKEEHFRTDSNWHASLSF